jgi:hypothetical protein
MERNPARKVVAAVLFRNRRVISSTLAGWMSKPARLRMTAVVIDPAITTVSPGLRTASICSAGSGG